MIVFFEQDFAHVSEEIDEDVEDAFDATTANKIEDCFVEYAFETIFAHVSEDVDDDVEDARDVCETIFVNEDYFVEVVSMHATTNINRSSFANDVEDVSMLVMTNKNILVTNDKIDDDLVNNVEGVSMLVMTDKLYLVDTKIEVKEIEDKEDVSFLM